MNITLSNNEIILVAMAFATIIMIIIGLLKNVIYKHLFKKGVKRTQYIKQLVKNEDIPFVLINVDNEPSRIAPTLDNNGLIIDGKLYNNKNSLFLEEDGRIYVVGKKEDFLIALMGGAIGRRQEELFMDKIVLQEDVNNEDVKILNPYEYFQSVKDRVQEMNDEKLSKVYANAIHLADLYNQTGQKKGLRKLIFHIESIMKEKKVIDAGITKFVYRDDIEEYIDKVANKQVVILDIASYERVIPEEVANAMIKVKDLFDEFYIVCTDYNGKLSKQVQKERREKDPILFGAFLDRDKQAINERFYYIGDWVDEYCDLTLDKMVAEMQEANGKDIINEIPIVPIPSTDEELKEQLNKLHLQEIKLEDGMTRITLLSSDEELKGKKSFFDKIKTFLGKKND